ncbi:hypothetical protein [Novosphingobium sp. LASN5T]|uniref:hypothetical protein n=1 Tax=Novosphingobium sp. LASN5T TaxID=2491021 RepID=UPI000F5EE2E3|nr:hypothetical protein [Novosphingobium sp. LASN5T]RQW43879.1 hypothetical protein EH199_11640 [Novosphingobium sp. LASN5T]
MREADLARSLGVSKATLSGWKARAVIPAVHAKWFAEEFAVAVLSGNQLNKMLDSRHAGIPAVFRVFQQTDFNPFGLEFDNSDQAIDVCEFYFGGLCRLALFIQNRLDLGDQVVMEMGLEKRTASLLWQMALAVRPRLAFRYGSRPPS